MYTNILGNLLNDIEKTKDEIFALEHVQFKSKKDGTVFKNPNNALVNGKISKDCWNRYYLYALFKEENNVYASSLSLYVGMENTVENWMKCLNKEIENKKCKVKNLEYTFDNIEDFEMELKKELEKVDNYLLSKFEINRFDYTTRNRIYSDVIQDFKR